MIDSRYAVEMLVDTAPPKIAYAYPLVSGTKCFTQQEALQRPGRFNPLIIGAYGARQLCRMEPRLRQTEVMTLQAYTPGVDDYPIFPGANFLLEMQEHSNLEAVSLFVKNRCEQSRRQRLLNYPGIILQCWTFRLPKLLWQKFQSLVVMWEK